jgi:hypothetical protein
MVRSRSTQGIYWCIHLFPNIVQSAVIFSSYGFFFWALTSKLRWAFNSWSILLIFGPVKVERKMQEERIRRILKWPFTIRRMKQMDERPIHCCSQWLAIYFNVQKTIIGRIMRKTEQKKPPPSKRPNRRVRLHVCIGTVFRDILKPISTLIFLWSSIYLWHLETLIAYLFLKLSFVSVSKTALEGPQLSRFWRKTK